ncbi:unnamed protein product [Plutella xylostella]|uniref:(diamondback moth) hypothetical protein n=1 Tax=Plutella xylostella TaxID=51655 RepID=A0A8S4G9X5_PLUXY|nr:unnamed protein product [Plutella xylostella]
MASKDGESPTTPSSASAFYQSAAAAAAAARLATPYGRADLYRGLYPPPRPPTWRCSSTRGRWRWRPPRPRSRAPSPPLPPRPRWPSRRRAPDRARPMRQTITAPSRCPDNRTVNIDF